MSGFSGFGGHGGETQRFCNDDGSPLVKRTERGVTIDECQRCGLIVLDAGELEAIISAITSQPGFRARPHVAQAYYGGGHHRTAHHRTSGIFSSFFSS